MPAGPFITINAVQRAREVAGARSDAEARAMLSGRAFDAAVVIRARVVRLGSGARAMIEYDGVEPAITTVLPPAHGLPAQLRPEWLGGYPPVGAGERAIRP